MDGWIVQVGLTFRWNETSCVMPPVLSPTDGPVKLTFIYIVLGKQLKKGLISNCFMYCFLSSFPILVQFG